MELSSQAWSLTWRYSHRRCNCLGGAPRGEPGSLTQVAWAPYKNEQCGWGEATVCLVCSILSFFFSSTNLHSILFLYSFQVYGHCSLCLSNTFDTGTFSFFFLIRWKWFLGVIQSKATADPSTCLREATICPSWTHRRIIPTGTCFARFIQSSFEAFWHTYL